MRECVGAIIVRQESVLLGKRSANRKFYPNVWDIFGGHVESGESNRQALERELAEELGIVIAEAHYIETLSIPSLEGDHMECRLYLVTEWTGTPENQQPQEHSEIGWFPFEAAKYLHLAAPEYVRIFEDVGRYEGKTSAGS
jgi:mutator protein MutT